MTALEVYTLIILPLIVLAIGWGAALYVMRTGRSRAPGE